jgi:hypothetical protein
LENEGKLYTRLRHRFLTRGDDDDGPQPRCSVVVERAPARNSNLQPDFNVIVCDTSTSAVLRELDESNRSVHKSAESTAT